ncbi:hypothetical protein PENSPDRAFT_657811 [Peniophora sp. CONT]|nr:hypothetical protein PENSPDRAFT_657811 [Peniophora sp. CONT]
MLRLERARRGGACRTDILTVWSVYLGHLYRLRARVPVLTAVGLVVSDIKAAYRQARPQHARAQPTRHQQRLDIVALAGKQQAYVLGNPLVRCFRYEALLVVYTYRYPSASMRKQVTAGRT